MDTIEIRPEAMVLHPINGMVLKFTEQSVPDVLGLWVCLGVASGFLWFERMAKSPTVFRSRQWRQEPDPALGPQASAPNVLWSRQAAVEANQALTGIKTFKPTYGDVVMEPGERSFKPSDTLVVMGRDGPDLSSIASPALSAASRTLRIELDAWQRELAVRSSRPIPSVLQWWRQLWFCRSSRS